MKILKSIIAILSLILSNSAFGQGYGIIQGTITDKENTLPISNAKLTLLQSNSSCISDSLGRYLFTDIPSGTYSIEVQSTTHETFIVNDVNVLVNKTTVVQIELQEIIVKIGAAEVKTQAFENNRSNPVSGYSFSREEISLNPGAQGDIFRAIGMLPGVSSSGGIYSAIAVRGQGVRDNVYLVDDIPLTEVGHLEGNSFFNDPNGGRFSIFAPRVIDNAQFIGGGFSADYGRRSASYLGLRIKEGNNVNSIFDGQVDLLGVNLNAEGPSKIMKNTSFFLSARYQNFYGLVNLIGLKDIGLPIYGDFLLKTSTALNAKNKLNFLFMVCPEHYVRDIDNVYADKNLNLLYLPDFKRNKIIIGLNLRTLTGTNSVWKNILYYNKYTSNVAVGKAYPTADSSATLLNPTIPFDVSIQTQKYSESKIGYRSLYNYNLHKNHRISLGFECDVLALKNERRLENNDTNFVFRRSELIQPNVLYQVISPNLVNATFEDLKFNTSLFSTYSLSLGKRISLNMGIRYDYTGFSKQHAWSPRLSGSYYLSDNSSISMALGKYYQDPVYSDIADNQKLKMEEVTQYIASFKHTFGMGIRFTLEAWYKDFDNLVVTPIGGSIFKNNNGTGYGKGLDVNLTKKLVKKLHGQIGYSYIEILRNDHDGFGSYNFAFSQPHQINFMVSHKTSKHFTFSLKYRYATGKPKDEYIIHRDVLNNTSYLRYSKEIIGKNAARLPNFKSLDIRVNYHFNAKTARLTAFFDVVNIANKQIANAESFNPISGKNYFDGLAIFPTGGLKFEF